MRKCSKVRIRFFIVVSSIFLGACAHSGGNDSSDSPYYSFCGGSIFGPDIGTFLNTHGIDCLAAGSNLGGTDWVVRATPEERFRARNLVLAQVTTAGWKVSWPADFIVLMDEWDQFGFEKGPWVRLASVRHGKMATETFIGRLNRSGIPTYFMFGETSDVVFVKGSDATVSLALLKGQIDAAVTIHAQKICSHIAPPLIRKGTPTALTLVISGSDSERPLRDRVENLMCSRRLPGGRIEGYWMQSKDRPDGTLEATYELPPIPIEASGFIEYSFSFNLDGRAYWHRSSFEPFRVPLK